ncbi:T9SS type A sorting domain-containing protein [Spirosoma koreense]
MKALIKSLAIALSLGFITTAASFAEPNPGGRSTSVATYKTGIYSTTTGKLQIALDKEKGGPVDIVLKDAGGKVLYSKHLGKNDQTYRTRLNLSELEDGVYHIEISNGVETTTQNITLATHQPVAPSRLVSLK